MTMTEEQSRAPRIVVGIDGSAQSKQALRWAARIASAEHATIDVVSVWHLPTYFGFAALPEDFTPKADVEKLLTDAVDEVFGPDRPIGMRMHVFEGDPARILLEVSKGALMAIVGSRGHGGFAGVLLGSVSMKLAELATCPVLVVHGPVPDPEVAS
jgi:nucleotide-binding universal stress UspA family protein